MDKEDNKIKTTLQDYPITPPEDLWEKIELDLVKINRKKRIRESSLIAAAVIIGFFGLLFLRNIAPEQPSAPQIATNTDIPKQPNTIKQSNNKIAIYKDRETQKPIAETIPDQSQETKDLKEPKDLPKQTTGNPITTNKEIKKNTKDIEQNQNISLFEEPENINTIPSNKNKSIIALYSTLPHGHSATFAQESMLYRGYSATMSHTPYNNINITEDDIPYSTEYSTPISFGFNLLIPLAKNTYAGTGLFYTKLSTTQSYSNISQPYKKKTTLQYLGIPFSINYKILDSKYIDLYATYNISIEKCIYANENRQQDNVSINQKLNAKNIQLSTNLSLGVELSLSKNTGIYFNSGISYYFRSNQPISIRTEKPTQLNLELGFRVHFTTFTTK